MSVRWRIRWSGLAVVALFLTGCTTGGGTEPDASSGSSTGLAAPGRAPDVPAGSRLVTCVSEEAHAKADATPTATDLTVGAISWPGLKGWATGDPASYGSVESSDYKVGVVVRAGAVVTVSVVGPDAGGVGLKYGQRSNFEPTTSVTFQGCKDYDTAYMGGFHVPDRKCISFDIVEGGKPAVRVTVSFFAGPC